VIDEHAAIFILQGALDRLATLGIKNASSRSSGSTPPDY
jgi:hypothetical protein